MYPAAQCCGRTVAAGEEKAAPAALEHVFSPLCFHLQLQILSVCIYTDLHGECRSIFLYSV